MENFTPKELQVTTSKRQQVYVWVRQNDIVDAAAGWFHSFSSRFTQLSEPPHLSDDDEHMWIGLAP